jgi:hypothetical protein
MNEQDRITAAAIWPQHMKPAFTRLWDDDTYAVARTKALSWLGKRYLLAEPINARQKTATIRKTAA